MSNNAHDLSNRLLNALDNNYNVVDMQAVNEIISILEKFNITKELLETTRLGKHVNELRRKTTDPTLARRAKVLVKRWRDLVIPTVASPGHTGSNRSSAERQVRRLGGTPLTSPALSRVVSPAVNSPRPPSRPAWGGYESDSQDVILVDDDPPAPPFKPLTPPVKRPTSPVAVNDEKKAKRDKKPKKRRGHSRAGCGVGGSVAGEGVAPGAGGAWGAGGAGGAWGARNGRNGCRPPDAYAALVNRLPPAGAKKVKTTKELLEEIQSRGSRPTASPASPRSPASPDVMLIEPDACPIKVESPVRNGVPPARVSPPLSPAVPLEDEREHRACECGDTPGDACPAAAHIAVTPWLVHALHNTLLPGVNGTRAPLHPHKFAVRPAEDPSRPGLFASVVPLYKYTDYAEDHCAKGLWRVRTGSVPVDQLAPSPPPLPRPPTPPTPRPYPIDPDPDGCPSPERPSSPTLESPPVEECPNVLSMPTAIMPTSTSRPCDRLAPAVPSPGGSDPHNPGGSNPGGSYPGGTEPAPDQFASELREHRTVERTKTPPDDHPPSPEKLDGRALYAQCRAARESIPYDYSQLYTAPEVSLGSEPSALGAAVAAAQARAEAADPRDPLGRPARPARFAEWHECARLGDLLALPYVVID